MDKPVMIGVVLLIVILLLSYVMITNKDKNNQCGDGLIQRSFTIEQQTNLPINTEFDENGYIIFNGTEEEWELLLL